MIKQEEVREQTRGYLIDCFKAKGCSGAFYNSFADSFSKSLLVLLDGLGVVIKVDRELPDRIFKDNSKYNDDYAEGYLGSQGDMLKAGYVKVEPLIEG